MSDKNNARIIKLLRDHEQSILANWTTELLKPGVLRSDLIREAEMRAQCEELLGLIVQATRSGNFENIRTAEWAPVREMLSSLSWTRAKQGFTPTEVSIFVLSLQSPIFALLEAEADGNVGNTLTDVSTFVTLINHLALLTNEAYLKGKEEVITRQQEDMLELSTPVVKLWDGILALPIIGTLDSARTQVVMENLLQAIVDYGAEVAIIDITGVATVDTLVSQHLLKTVAAARLMGAECIISGIRPQIAQTIVHLGVDLTEVSTKSTLADAFKLALKKLRINVGSAPTRQL